MAYISLGPLGLRPIVRLSHGASVASRSLDAALARVYLSGMSRNAILAAAALHDRRRRPARPAQVFAPLRAMAPVIKLDAPALRTRRPSRRVA